MFLPGFKDRALGKENTQSRKNICRGAALPPAGSTAPILQRRRCGRISGAEESEGFHGKGDGKGKLFSLKNFINRIDERNFPGYTG